MFRRTTYLEEEPVVLKSVLGQTVHFELKKNLFDCRCKLKLEHIQHFRELTFISFSRSPPQRDCSGIRNGLHVGFRLFFTT